ncbi:MAG: hypothetical protein RLZZ111_1860 [Planctomycetota bacterium]
MRAVASLLVAPPQPTASQDAGIAPRPACGTADAATAAWVARYWHVAAAAWPRIRDRLDVPREVRQACRSAYLANLSHNAVLRGVALDLIGGLNRLGIVPMLLKGGCQLFDPPGGHAGTRVMVDLDLLVPSGRDQEAFAFLMDRGYEPEAGWNTERHHHWPKAKGPGHGVVAEIHKTPWDGGGSGEAEAFFHAAVPCPAAGVQCLLPCTRHRLLHNAVHGVESALRHSFIWEADEPDRAVRFVNLRQLFDFAELAACRSDDIDWQLLLAEADRFGHGADLRQWAFLAEDLFRPGLPGGVAIWEVDRPERRSPGGRLHAAAKVVLRRLGWLDAVRAWRSRAVN